MRAHSHHHSRCSPRGRWNRFERPASLASATAADAVPVPRPARAGQAASVVVVGGGVGGLVAAGRLARAGLDVTLLEQNDQVGGRCQSERLGPNGEWRFDTGPSLLLFPDTYRQAFASLGARLEEWVTLQRVGPAAYRVWFPPQPDHAPPAAATASNTASSSGSSGSSSGSGGSSNSGSASSRSSSTHASAEAGSSDGGSSPKSSSGGGGDGGGGGAVSSLDLLYDVQSMVAQLEGVEVGAGRAYLAWLAAARTALEVGTRNFIARDLGDGLAGAMDLADPRRLLPLLGSVDLPELLGPHDMRLRRRFRDPRLRAMLSFQDLYVGLTPSTAPGVYSLLAATEITDGVWYPVGGFGEVRDALAALAASNGATIRTGARVTRVLCEGGAVTGVLLEGGERVGAQAVVMNRDVPGGAALADDPRAQRRAARLDGLDYSAGVIAFNWALDCTLPRLLQHNVFLSGEWERSWRRARSPAELLPRPNMYVHCPSRTDPSAAPPGGDSVMVLLPVANMQERGGDEDYGALVAAGRRAVLATLEAAGVGALEGHVRHERVIGPGEWRDRYGLQHGAAFGLSHGLTQLALLRPGPSDPDVAGLYYVGASARPGNGVPLVMMGAEVTAARVLRDMGVGAER